MQHLFVTTLITSALLAPAFAQHARQASANDPVERQGQPTVLAQAAEPASTAELVDGEIRKVDIEGKKLTIRHGVIKSLDMPGMTMVFQVRDVQLLEKVKTGDKIRFRVEKAGSALVVTAIEPAQ